MNQRHKSTTCARAVMVSAALTLFSVAPSSAEAMNCRLLPGSYVTTITDIEGVFASRSIMTFVPGGALVVTDSRQGGQTGVYEPFSAGQGSWSCETRDDSTGFSALSLTFTTPPGSAGSKFGRVDYEGVVDSASGGISGQLSLRISESRDLEGADPLSNPGEVLETFDFSGQRIQPN